LANIISYLTFNGNCREAMTFYKECLGGELTLQTIGETSPTEEMPQEMKDCVLQATLQHDNIVLMASDMVEDEGLKKGNNICLMLYCDSEGQMQNCYEKLSKGGKQTHPIVKTDWGALFGSLTDRFGNNWLLNFHSDLYQ
jgi:PhnB protein